MYPAPDVIAAVSGKYRRDFSGIFHILRQKTDVRNQVFFGLAFFDGAVRIERAVEIPGRDHIHCKIILFHEFKLIDGVLETLEALSGHYRLVVATKGDVTEQMFKYRRSGLDRYFHHCEVMENKDEKNYLELAAKNDLQPEQILMVGNSVKSDIAPVINVGGWAINTPHDVVWVHEMMDMPESDRIIIVQNVKEIVGLLL